MIKQAWTGQWMEDTAEDKDKNEGCNEETRRWQIYGGGRNEQDIGAEEDLSGHSKKGIKGYNNNNTAFLKALIPTIWINALNMV